MRSTRGKQRLAKLLSACAFLLIATPMWISNGWAGPIFLTGHDPDFHSQDNTGAQNLLRIGLEFATGGTTFSTTEKFLWIESRSGTPGGHRIGENGLASIGLSLGTHYDRANAAELALVDFSNYTALAIASSFGGLLRRVELDELISRTADIETYINAGGGLFASSECFPCGANLLAGPTAPDLFGYLPVNVTSIGAALPFNPTAFGSSLGLVVGDLNSPTHNSFGIVGGLNIVDTDSAGNATTLAGVVRIGGDGFIPPTAVPVPSTLLLLGSGLAGLGLWGRKRRKERVYIRRTR